MTSLSKSNFVLHAEERRLYYCIHILASLGIFCFYLADETENSPHSKQTLSFIKFRYKFRLPKFTFRLLSFRFLRTAKIILALEIPTKPSPFITMNTSKELEGKAD